MLCPGVAVGAIKDGESGVNEHAARVKGLRAALAEPVFRGTGHEADFWHGLHCSELGTTLSALICRASDKTIKIA